MPSAGADLEEKQEPRAATSVSAERRAEGMWHDVTTKGLTEAAIEKPTFSTERRLGSCGGNDKVTTVLREDVNTIRTIAAPLSFACKEVSIASNYRLLSIGYCLTSSASITDALPTIAAVTT